MSSRSASPSGGETSPGPAGRRGPGGAPAAAERGAGWILALACALATVRLYGLGAFGLWIDEAYTWVDLSQNLEHGELFNPLGYRAVGAMVALFGGRPDEVALRLFPALVGVACVPLSAFAFRPALGARRAALAALLLSASSWQVFWSQNARFYTFAQAVSLVGAGLALRALLAAAPGPRALAGLGAGVAVMAAAAAFHPTAAFLLPGLVAGAAAARWIGGERAPALRAGLVVLAGLAVLGLVGLALFGLDAVAHHATQKPVANPLSGVVHLAKTCGYFFTPWWLAAGLFGAFDALRRRAPGELFVAAGAATCLAVAALLATRAQMTAQYVFTALPWVAALAVAPLRPLPGPGRWLPVGAFALVFLPTLSGTGLYFAVRGGERAPWREAYEFVADVRAPGEMVLGMGSAVGEFYLGGANAALRHPDAVCDLAEWFPDGPRRWARRERRIWVVVRPQWLDGFADADRRTLEGWLRDDCRLVRRFAGDMEGRDLDVLVYVRD